MQLLRPHLGSSLLCWLFLQATIGFAELVTLEVTPNQFPEPSSASVFVDAGLDSDEVSSSISGELVLDLLPTAVNPTSAQITALNLQVDDEIEFALGGGFLLPRIGVGASAGEIKLNLVEAGPAGEINQGVFTQPGNTIGLQGTVEASLAEEPFDLSEQEPTTLDFESIGFENSRDAVALTFDVSAEVEFPVEAGFLTINVLVGVDGELLATGAVPAAEYVWQAVNGNDSVPFADTSHWLRERIADTNSIPSATDTAIFVGARAITLDGVQTIREAIVDGSIQFQDGTLQLSDAGDEAISSNAIRIDRNSLLQFAESSMLESESPISVSGGGQLTIDGTASELNVIEGIVSGDGQIEQLTVGDNAALQLDTTSTLNVTSQLSIEGDVHVASFDDLQSFVVVEAGQILATGVQRVVVGESELTASGNGRYATHQGDGIFVDVLIGSTDIVVRNERAIPGDADGNGTVEFADFLSVSANFGMSGSWLEGDFDGDGMVVFADFLALSDNFGSTQTITAVPEPAANWLILAVGLIFFARFENT